MEVLSKPKPGAPRVVPLRLAQAGTEPAPRMSWLDGMRALTCLTIVLHHLMDGIWNRALLQQPFGIVRPLIYLNVLSPLAVGMLVVICGFCLMLPVVRNGGRLPGGALRFFGKRAGRLLPAYYAGLCFSLALWPIRASLQDLITHALLVHNLDFRTIDTVNCAYGPLGVGLQICLSFPLLVWSWRRFGAVRSVSVTVPSAFLLCLWGQIATWYGLMPQLHILFGFGMIAAAIVFSPGSRWRLVRDSVPWGLTTTALAATILLSFKIWHLEGCQAGMPFLHLLTGLFTLSLIVVCSTSPLGRVRRVLEWKPLVWLGTFSYSTYLVHGFLIHYLGVYCHRHFRIPFHLRYAETYAILVVLGVPLILALSYLFHLAFERPFVRALRAE